MRNKTIFFLLFATLMLILMACSDSDDELVIYTPAGDDLIDNVIPQFEEETGIQVELVTAGTGELLNRISGEAENPIADVLWGGSPSLIRPQSENFQEYVSDNDQYLEEDFQNHEGYMTRFSSTAPVLIVNTELTSDMDINGYEDLLNPELTGSIAHGDATASSSAYNHLENMLFAMGENNDPFSDAAWNYVADFLDILDGTIISSSGAVHRGVADGEYAVGLTWEEPALEYVQDGAPVEVVYMEEGVIFKEASSSIINEATNLENAQIFTDFLISEEIQGFFGTETSSRPVRSDADLSDHMISFDELNVLEYDDAWGDENQDEVNERYMSLFTGN